MGAEPEIFSLGEALDALASPDAHERFATANGAPLLVVDWPLEGGPTPRLDAARARLGLDRLPSLACVTVALVQGEGAAEWTAPLRAFDLSVTSAAELEAVRATLASNPIASTALVQLLRGSLARSVEEDLVAESLAYSTLQGGPEFTRWRAERPVRAIPPDPPEGAVVASRDGATLCLELNRPDRHNALSLSLRDALCEALDVARFDDAIETVHVCGRGASFCSGGDLDEFGAFSDTANAHLIRTTRSPARRFAELADRLRVRVHGACLGAGVELPAFAGFVSAAPDARFGLPELSMGLVPGAGGTASLPRRIGRHATAKLALIGGTIDATEALSLGLIDAIED